VRWLVVVVALGACGFQHGALSTTDAPITDGADATDAAIDAISTACAVEVVAASAHTCIRKNDGTVWCWGKNGQGEVAKDPTASAVCNVGGNDYRCVKTPRQVPLTGATGMGTGDQHTCVLVAGTTYCFGANDSGQFGNGPAGDSFDPVEITERANATQIAGSEASTCSINAGTVACSGLNNHGEVGDGSTTLTLTPLTAQANVQKLAMGFQNACSVSASTVYCWGDNADGQVDTTTMPRYTPTAVQDAPLAADISVGFGHVCARSATNTLTCWGRNAEGQIGTGATGASAPPTLVALTDVAQVAAGGYHTCARLGNGEVRCWGESYSPSPTKITLSMPAISIASGSYHGCAVLADGSVWCWGWNAYGQLGNDAQSTQINNTPVKGVVCP
jgi:alpha-tubulin suppressor-like RCC1 family protein